MIESFFYEFYKSNNIKINLNILETGLFNIFILILILIYVKESTLDDILKKRKIIIIKDIQTVDNKLIEANKCFEVKNKQFINLTILNSKLRSETNFIKKKVIKSIIKQFQNDLDILFDKYLSKICFERQHISSEVYQKIVYLVLEKFKIKIQLKLKKREYTNKLLNEIINKFENTYI